LAEDFVQDSLIRILDNLESYEGRSRFTTWAQKVAVRVALTELRRKRWRDVSLDAPPSAGAGTTPRDAGPGGREPDAARAGASSPHGTYPGPAEQVERADTVGWIKRLMVEELTEKQRTAIRAVAFAGLPLEEVARRMGTNRNALYKLIHDARKRLKGRLSREGVSIEDVLHSMDRE
jgi:RNA polymerase sigma-70 factor (ECF subfamily)